MELPYLSKIGKKDTPDNLKVEVIYILTLNNELELANGATTDKKTVVNSSSHAFLNLYGQGSETVLW